MANGENPLAAYTDRTTRLASELSRLARLMGLKIPAGFDDVALAHEVANGLPTAVVIAFTRILGRSKVIGLMVPEASYRRLSKQGKPLPREHSERLYEVGRVVDTLGRIFHGDLDAVLDFLYSPHPLFDGETPFDLARSSSAGSDAVLNFLWGAEAGVPV